MIVGFKRVAMVNRGEAAMRFLTAARELNREQGAGLACIALYTTPDRRAMFVREADEAYDLGAPTVVDPRDGQRKSTYVDLERLERALVATRAEAAWAGWGFVAEIAEFADLCTKLGIVCIGPSGDTMRKLGNKITAKRLAEQVGVPVLPWSGGPVRDAKDALAQAARLGYPLLVKAAAGGGGRGIRRASNDVELVEALESARAEALYAFGSSTVFLESEIAGARHVEVQIMADSHGNTWAVGLRDGTVQRRYQKVIEEAPPPGLDLALDREIRSAAVRLCQAVGYTNAGAVEFLVQPGTRTFAFMEVNARQQVEHPITEVTTGLDLVKLQIHLASGGRLEGDPPKTQGYAIEARLCAEDPDRGFAPASGTFERFRLPTGPGLRIDTGFDQGDAVGPDFDSMVAKVIAHGQTRSEALARLRRGLGESALLLRGGATNKGFLLEVLRRRELDAGSIDVGWVDRLVLAGEHRTRRGVDIALLAAAVDAHEREATFDKHRFFRAAFRGRLELEPSVARQIELSYSGHKYKLEVRRLSPLAYSIVADGRVIEVTLERLGRGESRLTVGSNSHRLLTSSDGTTHIVEVDGVPHRISSDRGGVIRSPSPGLVVNVSVHPGDEIARGDRILVLEAMKMELEVRAEQGGRIREVLVGTNVQVAPGTPLVSIEPGTSEEQAAGAGRVRFDHLPLASLGHEGQSWRTHLAELTALVLGYDVDAGSLRRLVAEQGSLALGVDPADLELWHLEDRVLMIFVDRLSLFRRAAPSSEEEAAGGVRLSPNEAFLGYLRDLADPSRGLSGGGAEVHEALSAAFREILQRALAHYGVQGIERTPELEDALVRIFKAHLHRDEQLVPIQSLLERRLEAAPLLLHRASESFRDLLDRLIGQTHGELQGLHEIARSVRYQYFERPLVESVSRRGLLDAEEHVLALEQQPDRTDREDHIAALVDCAQPLKRFLSARLLGASPGLKRAVLEVLLRRYYRIRELAPVEVETRGDLLLARSSYALDGKRVHVIGAHVEHAHLPEALAKAVSAAEEVPAGDDAVVDLWTWHSEPFPEAEALARHFQELLAGLPSRRPLRRIVVSPSSAQVGVEGARFFTFRPSPSGGYGEERTIRGLHPMMAKRMHLWRLSRFDLERLPSSEDVYLFRATGRENPKDVRLIALAEVRDLTALRDRSGQVVALPQLERMLLETLASMRAYQAGRGPGERLHWNRVELFVWPGLLLSPEDLDSILERLAPVTEGLGLERVLIRTPLVDRETGKLSDQVIDVFTVGRRKVALRFREPPTEPLQPLSLYTQRVVRLRQLGLSYPYEIIGVLAPPREGARGAFPPGEFIEHDLGPDGMTLVPVDRPPGENQANIVVGLIKSFTTKVPEGMTRVILLGDPSKDMGALAEPECRRIEAAIALAQRLDVPLEWFALSAGAKISMESGTENMDWIALVLRRLIEFTQAGGEVNVIVDGINVGAQPYWNAEATMLMHTRGILVMTDQGAMVLTGKRALDYSGGISADDNFGIGGFERIMGPNGQAQYHAEDLIGAIEILFQHYEHTYKVPKERFPRPARTTDPRDRDIRSFPHAKGYGFATVGEVLSEAKNAERKKPFDIRSVLRAVIDQDLLPLERWFAQRGAEVSVVWDAHVGGYPICLLGIESRPLARRGFVPADGPEQWTAGTLFPLASKKTARAINAASNNRPLVVLANLSGFDGSPESLRHVQLEYGAEIGRAVVNFKGPIVFCVISRYHGGAFVVFSARLNDQLEVAAIEGSYASVIGGAPAAAVVFAREVERRTRKDRRVAALEQDLARAEGASKARLRARLDEVYRTVQAEMLGAVAQEFDAVHTVERARQVGSVHRIIAPGELRPYLIDAIERGINRELALHAGAQLPD